MAEVLSAACVPPTFHGIGLFGGEVLSVTTNLVTNFTAWGLDIFRFTQPTIPVQNATFCNVTVSYTHPGQNDNTIVETWLPIENPSWNNRFQAAGGGGWATGRWALSYETMKGAIGDGYATSTTDAGLGSALDPSEWALISPGNVNWYKLNNFASVSLNDQAIISKALIKRFYGKGPAFSYWNGCSQGGRQGLMLAQRYPTAYDGISAGAPVLYSSLTGMSLYWPQEVMNRLKTYPYGCEMDAISAAAITACDELDGVTDGIVSDVDACLRSFNPFQLIGTLVPDCRQAGNRTVEIGTAAAVVVNATWHGIVTAKREPTWYGLSPGTYISNEGGAGGFETPGIASTKCSNGTCVGNPNSMAMSWMKYFLARGDPNFDAAEMTYAEFDDMVRIGRQIYRSVMDTDDPDLTRFRDAGGKMVTFHGLWDTLVPPNATRRYHSEISALLPDTDSFYRHFEVPGLGHCWGHASGQPTSLFDQLRAWVENGTAPEQTPVDIKALDGSTHHRILCPYPQTARFDKEACGDPADTQCWSCDAGAGAGDL
ncbi:tannase and feruloyl esterase [Parathielavia appendiculata]|uniref:Carboxylic ester hydrolase n=1 Tax=Parathielavia appendiculata TaxID=2587402 RepID=A0AAN6UBQ4_9PEZI|nr:tannase and feruloyl esterase [Parathielavia appendiculata]